MTDARAARVSTRALVRADPTARVARVDTRALARLGVVESRVAQLSLRSLASLVPAPAPLPPHPAWPGTTYGPIIEIGYPLELGDEYRYDLAMYDTTGRYGPWWIWERVDCEAQNATIVRGASSPAERISSATATVTLTDPDGVYAPWRIDPVTGERPNRANLPLRISVTDGATVWPLFTGWVDVWNDVDAWDDPGTVTITASDGFKHLALVDQGETAAQGAGEAAGARISRVLDRAGWQNLAPRELSTGTIPLQATTLAGPGARRDPARRRHRSGGGVGRRVGHVPVRGPRLAPHRRQHGAVAGSVTAHRATLGAACASAIVSVADDMAIQNVIGVSRVGGTASWLEDTASIAKYGRHPWSRFDLPYANDADTATILAVQLADRADRDYFLEAVVLSPLTEETAWPIVLSVELFDTVFVTRRRGGQVLQEYASVIGVDHTLGPAEMVTVLSLGPRLQVHERPLRRRPVRRRHLLGNLGSYRCRKVCPPSSRTRSSNRRTSTASPTVSSAGSAPPPNATPPSRAPVTGMVCAVAGILTVRQGGTWVAVNTGYGDIAARSTGLGPLATNTWHTVASSTNPSMPAGKWMAFGVLTIITTALANGNARLSTTGGDSFNFEWECATSASGSRGQHAATVLWPFTTATAGTVTANLQIYPYMSTVTAWESTAVGVTYLGG